MRGTRQTKPTIVGASKRDLRESEQRLLILMQLLNFGRLEHLHIRDGEPVLDPGPRVVRERKLGAVNGPRPEAAATDFALKQEVREFFQELRALGTGTIETVLVRHGLPFWMAVAEDTPA